MENSTATALWFKIITNTGTDISVLRISYLAVDPTFTHPFSISFFT